MKKTAIILISLLIAIPIFGQNDKKQRDLVVINLLGAKVYEEPTFDSKTLNVLPVGNTILMEKFIETRDSLEIGAEFSLPGKWVKPHGINGFIFSSDLTDKKVKIETDKSGRAYIDLKGELTLEENREEQVQTAMGKFPKYFEYKYYENGNYTYSEWDGCFTHSYEYQTLSINEVYHQMISDYGLQSGNQIFIPLFIEKADKIIKFEGEGATQDLSIEYKEDGSIMVSSYDCT